MTKRGEQERAREGGTKRAKCMKRKQYNYFMWTLFELANGY